MPILHSNLETDLRMASRLDQGLLVTLTDSAHVLRLPGQFGISFLGSVNGTLSDTHGVRFASLGGADAFSATGAENTDESETALTDTSVNIAVVRHALVRNIGDLADWTGDGSISPESLAADMVNSYHRGFNADFATAVATASTNVGASGVDMSVDDFYDATYQLELNSVPGPYYALLHPRQIADFRESLRGEAGPAQWKDAAQDMLDLAGPGVKGSFLGVTIAASEDITSAGGNREGGMWGAGAFGRKIAVPAPRVGAGTMLMVRMDELIVEVTRDASTAVTEIVGGAYYGVSVLEQARLVGIVTDA